MSILVRYEGDCSVGVRCLLKLRCEGTISLAYSNATVLGLWSFGTSWILNTPLLAASPMIMANHASVAIFTALIIIVKSCRALMDLIGTAAFWLLHASKAEAQD